MASFNLLKDNILCDMQRRHVTYADKADLTKNWGAHRVQKGENGFSFVCKRLRKQIIEDTYEYYFFKLDVMFFTHKSFSRIIITLISYIVFALAIGVEVVVYTYQRFTRGDTVTQNFQCSFSNLNVFLNRTLNCCQ